MTRYSFVGQVVLNPDGSLGASLAGQAWTDDVGGTDVTADLLSDPGVSVVDFTTDATGCPPHVYGPDGVTTLWYSFAGGPRFPVQGVDVTEDLLQDYINGVLDAVPAGIIGAPTNWPASFPPDPHTEPVASLRGSTGLALSLAIINLLNAGNAGAARSAISAAPDTTMSFPGFGTTAGLASQGNHGHTAGQIVFTPSGTITATDVQTAIVQAASSGPSTGGSGDEFSVYYSGGAYPSSAASPPSGTKRRHFYGPSAYLGATINGILDLYTPTGPTPLGT